MLEKTKGDKFVFYSLSCPYAGGVQGVRTNPHPTPIDPDEFHPSWIFQPASQPLGGPSYISKGIKTGVISIDHNYKKTNNLILTLSRQV